MALDTALKRGSAINVGSPWRAFLPLPDGTIAAADRQVIPFVYSGILAAGGGSAPGSVYGDFYPFNFRIGF